jgi:hypothetical protein
MIPVTLEYKPIWPFPWSRSVEVKLPARWSELSYDQFTSIPAMQQGRLDDISILSIFLGVGKKIARRLDSYQRFCILRNLKYISQPDPFDKFIIREIEGLRAPGDRLYGVTWGAFIFGDTYFQDYIQGDKRALNKFIVCFYTDGSFNEKLIMPWTERIKDVNPDIREAIAINYKLIREWLAKAYPMVFEKKEENKKQSGRSGWVAVNDLFVGDDVANQDKYAALPASTVLRYMNRKLKEYYKHGSKIQRPGRIL